MTESMNKDSMRDLNQKLMLQFLFNRPGTSRIEIANHLKLNKSTISSLYNTLFEQGYIIELGHGMSLTYTRLSTISTTISVSATLLVSSN